MSEKVIVEFTREEIATLQVALGIAEQHYRKQLGIIDTLSKSLYRACHLSSSSEETLEKQPYFGSLYDFSNEYKRPATFDEWKSSNEEKKRNGTPGLIDVDGERCYVA